MIVALLGILKALPSSFKVAIGAALVIGAMNVSFWWKLRGRDKQIAKQEQTIKDRDAALVAAALVEATVRRALEEQRAETINVKAELEDQGAQVRAFALKAKASDATAAKLAIDVLRAGEREAEAIRANTNRPSGHESLNQALAERFK